MASLERHAALGIVIPKNYPACYSFVPPRRECTMRTGITTIFITLIFAVAACGNPRDTTAVQDTVGAGPGRSVDKQAEEQKIRGLEQRWREALAAKDSAAVGRFYAEGGFYLPQGSNGYEGPD